MRYLLCCVALVLSVSSVSAASPAGPAEDPVCVSLRAQLADIDAESDRVCMSIGLKQAQLDAYIAEKAACSQTVTDLGYRIFALSVTGKPIPQELRDQYNAAFARGVELTGLISTLRAEIAILNQRLIDLTKDRATVSGLLVQFGC